MIEFPFSLSKILIDLKIRFCSGDKKEIDKIHIFLKQKNFEIFLICKCSKDIMGLRVPLIVNRTFIELRIS